MAGLTRKDRGLLKLVTENGHNESEVARILKISQQAVSERLRKIQKKVSFSELLDNMGITDSYLAQKLRDGINSTKPKIVKEKTTQEDGTNIEIEKIIEVPDTHLRYKYTSTLLESKKIIRDTNNINNSITAIQINYGHRHPKSDIGAVRSESVDAKFEQT